MNHKWASNKGIQIGDIYRCDTFWGERPEYYEVTALRGRTQVVLHAIHSEEFAQEGIEEGSPLSLYRTRTRPLPGQFMRREEMWGVCEVMYRGRRVLLTGEEAVAWAVDEQRVEGRPYRLREVGPGWHLHGVLYNYCPPEEWRVWSLEEVRAMEEECRREHEQLWGTGNAGNEE